MSGRPILTAEQVREAEQRAIETGTSVDALMERAGKAAAEAVWFYAPPMETLILCGPGNNGGDGYVIARELRERDIPVRVAAFGEPRTEAAARARKGWGGDVEDIFAARPGCLLIDALFGTALRRPLEPALQQAFLRLAGGASVRVAVDVPSGIASDDGAILSHVPDMEMTVALASLKPSHLLYPAAGKMGRIVLADIGITVASDLVETGRPRLSAPGPTDHKYSRGYVAIVAGEMPGAAALAASAAARSGAGYVRIVSERPIAGVPRSVVQSSGSADELLRDSRIGAVLIGSGLGRDAKAEMLLEKALASGLPLVLDGDALTLLSLDPLLSLSAPPILTPHEGEFERLFGGLAGNKVERAREAARRSGAIVLLKGPDTVIASPDGRASIAPPAPHWLATAGTGDVLAGIVAAMCARGLQPYEAAAAAAWIHGRAAEQAGPGLIADDLLSSLPNVLAECL